MDYSRSREDRDNRGSSTSNSIGSTSRVPFNSRDTRPIAPVRFNRDSPPPPPIPLRNGFGSAINVNTGQSMSYQSIPLRPINSQRLPITTTIATTTTDSITNATNHNNSINSNSNLHYRSNDSITNSISGSSQLPPRPTQRYRSPSRPISPPQGLAIRSNNNNNNNEWESNGRRDREPSRAWERDDRINSGIVDRERERSNGVNNWDNRDDNYSRNWKEGGEREMSWEGRDSRDRERGIRGRSYESDSGAGGRRGFEVPYRQRADSRKRSRDNSDDEAREEDAYNHSRGLPPRATSPHDWRRNSSLPRRPIENGNNNGYAHPRFLDDNRDNLPRRPLSPPTGNDSFDLPPRRVSAPQLIRDNRDQISPRLPSSSQFQAPPLPLPPSLPTSIASLPPQHLHPTYHLQPQYHSPQAQLQSQQRQRSFSPGEITEGSHQHQPTRSRSLTPPRPNQSPLLASSSQEYNNRNTVRIPGALEARLKVLPQEILSFPMDRTYNSAPLRSTPNGHPHSQQAMESNGMNSPLSQPIRQPSPLLIQKGGNSSNSSTVSLPLKPSPLRVEDAQRHFQSSHSRISNPPTSTINIQKSNSQISSVPLPQSQSQSTPLPNHPLGLPSRPPPPSSNNNNNNNYSSHSPKMASRSPSMSSASHQFHSNPNSPNNKSNPVSNSNNNHHNNNNHNVIHRSPILQSQQIPSNLPGKPSNSISSLKVPMKPSPAILVPVNLNGNLNGNMNNGYGNNNINSPASSSSGRSYPNYSTTNGMKLTSTISKSPIIQSQLPPPSHSLPANPTRPIPSVLLPPPPKSIMIPNGNSNNSNLLSNQVNRSNNNNFAPFVPSNYSSTYPPPLSPSPKITSTSTPPPTATSTTSTTSSSNLKSPLPIRLAPSPILTSSLPKGFLLKTSTSPKPIQVNNSIPNFITRVSTPPQSITPPINSIVNSKPLPPFVAPAIFLDRDRALPPHSSITIPNPTAVTSLSPLTPIVPTLVSDLGIISKSPISSVLDKNAMDVDSVVPASTTVVKEVVAVVIEEVQPRAASPLPPRSPSPPISPPRDFDSILSNIIMSNEKDSGQVNELMELNRAKTKKERNSAGGVIRDLTNDLTFSQATFESHQRLRPFLIDSFESRDNKRADKIIELRNEYKVLNEDWKVHCRRLEKIKERIHRRKQPTTTLPTTPSIDPSSGLPFYPEPTTPGPSIVGGRANRRSTNAAFGYGDAVRSEAEFLEILASLETADMRDPTVRASRTAAIVPDMVVDDSERRNLLALEDNRRLVLDPVEFYSLQAPLDLWTEDEVQIFCKRFTLFPKQFGKISSELPDKTTSQCVLFYYRMKTTIDFRSLSDRRGRDGRRRKTNSSRRRIDTDGNGKKGASLISNLKRARADDRDEEEDSPPPESSNYNQPGGRNNRYGVESPSVFQPPESTSRPAALPEFEDFNQLLSNNNRSPYSSNSNKRPKNSKPQSQSQSLPQSTSKPAASKFLLSDSALEAAEALGALSAGGSGNEFNGSNADAAEVTAAAARRKASSSSYWSVAERNEFVRLLAIHGKEWNRLAKGLQNKTAVQCRNWFQNHQKKLNLANVVKSADPQLEVEEFDDVDFTVPTGVPLTESLNAVPRAGFFVPDAASRVRSPRTTNQELSDNRSPPIVKQMRNILNDDTPDEVSPTLGNKEDWFGGGSSTVGIKGRSGGDDGSTDEEVDITPKSRNVNRSPPRRQESTQSTSSGTKGVDRSDHPYGHNPRLAEVARFEEAIAKQHRYSSYSQGPPQPESLYEQQQEYQREQEQQRHIHQQQLQQQQHQLQQQQHQQQFSYSSTSFPPYQSSVNFPPRHVSSGSATIDHRSYYGAPVPPPSQSQSQSQASSHNSPRVDPRVDSRVDYFNSRPNPNPSSSKAAPHPFTFNQRPPPTTQSYSSPSSANSNRQNPPPPTSSNSSERNTWSR